MSFLGYTADRWAWGGAGFFITLQELDSCLNHRDVCLLVVASAGLLFCLYRFIRESL